MATVFIVDDNKGWVYDLSTEFQKYAEFTIAGTRYLGLPALESIKQQRPDVLCIDVALPDMQGITIVEEIRRDMPGYDPIIIMASVLRNDDVMAYVSDKLGVHHYIPKGAGHAHVVNVIRNIFMIKLLKATGEKNEAAIAHVANEIGLKENDESTLATKEALRLLLKHPYMKITKDIYPQVAALKGSSEKAVEKNIRNAIKRADKQNTQLYNQMFPLGLKPTNSQFIQVFVAYIKENFG